MSHPSLATPKPPSNDFEVFSTRNSSSGKRCQTRGMPEMQVMDLVQTSFIDIDYNKPSWQKLDQITDV